MRHSGECYMNTGSCSKCGKLGHWIAVCPENKEKGIKPNAQNHKPRENKPNARIFAITQEEADNAKDIVAGTILINKMHVYVLFNCGATHSFVSKRFAKKLKLEGETLSEPLRVATFASKTIETYKAHRNCKICIDNQIFKTELIQPNMAEFDAILGMNWLAKNHALVDFQKKSVKLQTPNHEEIIYHGRSKEQKYLLSASQIWKAMKSGEEIYLAMISEVNDEVTLKIEEIQVIQEFPDFFTEKLPGTIPDREVEFEINLIFWLHRSQKHHTEWSQQN
ncbi:uncharacterized protein LOC142541818 [Primulina tabacum]|uniref:uncharacterized protein LOC142541818 n=1 Tax=Primulina tabacum TaxID=48773 RepID=UPI003F599123